nr:immunoglobulin heavy chain junction region [Mus musculus]
CARSTWDGSWYFDVW